MSPEEPSSTHALLDAVRNALAPFEAVRQAYVFGSRVKGQARHDSDLDIAVHLDRTLDDAERGKLKLDLIAALTDELGALGERADVVDLDRASSDIGMRVLQEGRCVLSRDERERIELEVYIARRYDDDAPKRRLYEEAAKRVAARMGEDAQSPIPTNLADDDRLLKEAQRVGGHRRK